jgi:hypothetical protein
MLSIKPLRIVKSKKKVLRIPWLAHRRRHFRSIAFDALALNVKGKEGAICDTL